MARGRQLTIYEKNQLLKYGFDESDLLNQADLPVEYLTGFVNFKGLTIQLNRHVLIPRVESEELVDLGVAACHVIRNNLSYLELGTGSGAISLAILNALLKEQISSRIGNFVVTDVSVLALKLTQQNFLRLFKTEAQEIKGKLQFIQSNLLENVPQQPFDVIVANLPYIPSAKMVGLDASVKNYEPHLALDGGPSGFELINKMLQQLIAGRFLATGALILLEVDESHTLDFIKLKFPQLNKYFLIQAFTDQFARNRFLRLEKL